MDNSVAHNELICCFITRGTHDLHETCPVLVIDNSEKINIFCNKDRAMKILHKVHIYNANIPCEFHEDW